MQNLTTALLNRFIFPMKESIVRRKAGKTVKGRLESKHYQHLSYPCPVKEPLSAEILASLTRLPLYKLAALSSLPLLPLQFTSAPPSDSVYQATF